MTSHADAAMRAADAVDAADAADAMRAARSAFIVLEWVSGPANSSGLVLSPAHNASEVLTEAVRAAPYLPGVKEFILQAMRDSAEASLQQAYDVLSAHLQADLDPPTQPPGFSGIDGHHGVAAFAYPPGFSGIDGA